MVTIEVSLSSLFFFMLGFLTCAALIIVFAILWVILPRISEAKRFFHFWLKLKEKKRDESK
jgi:phage shock protein PspC (stress-responsive transcriptional regulator)